MAAVTVRVDYADGTVSQAHYPADLLDRYDAIVQRGLSGKALVWELLSDDWPFKPKTVAIEGTRRDGTPFKVRIYCL